jgi:hypothetical protein
VVPEAGLTEVTEKLAGEAGLTGMVLLPLPQPVKSGKDKATEETTKQKWNLVRSTINASAY